MKLRELIEATGDEKFDSMMGKMTVGMGLSSKAKVKPRESDKPVDSKSNSKAKLAKIRGHYDDVKRRAEELGWKVTELKTSKVWPHNEKSLTFSVQVYRLDQSKDKAERNKFLDMLEAAFPQADIDAPAPNQIDVTMPYPMSGFDSEGFLSIDNKRLKPRRSKRD